MGNHWVYGLLTKKKIRNSGRIDFAIATDDYSLANTIPINENTIGQFTGLKDIESEEIYEDDIVNDTGELHVVYYNDEYAAFLLDNNDGFDDDCKVVGNIHDNPELLGSDKND